MRAIVYRGDSILQRIAEEVPLSEIDSAQIHEVIQDMKTTLHREKFGVAIAAPQIGISLRIFVVGGHVFASRSGEEFDPKVHKDHVFINPEIVKASKKTVIGDEGCLSVPGKYGTKVKRSEKVTILYYDERGKCHTRGASSFLSRIFQHEIDHLNGILYIDNAIEVIDVDDELKPI
tara:strand:+ start:25289 stop:25816 length:528 start_codon:yes stop_codon:yes gene_type:complete